MKKRIRSMATVLALSTALMSTAIPSALAAPETAKAPEWKDGALFYDVNGVETSADGAWENTAAGNFAGFDGSSYVYLSNGSFEMNLDVPEAGAYDITVRAANDNNGNRFDAIYINGDGYQMTLVGTDGYAWGTATVGNGEWVDGNYIAAPPADGITLKKGSNIVKIQADWGYSAYDSITLTPKFELTPPSTDEPTTPSESDDPTTPSSENTATQAPADTTATEGNATTAKPAESTAVEKVEKAISALPSVIEQGDVAAVKAAQTAYAALTETEKASVRNADRLVYMNARVRAIEAGDTQKNALRFEAEDGTMEGNTGIAGTDGKMKNYSGSGYVFLFDSSFSVDIYVPQAGQYDIYIIGANDTTPANAGEGNKCDFVSINGGEKVFTSYLGKDAGTWTASYPGAEEWTEDNLLAPKAPEDGYALKAGKNTVAISANWGYCCYDAIVVVPRFNMVIADSLSSNGGTTNVNTGVGLPIAALATLGLASAGAVIGLPRRKKNGEETSEK